MNTEPNNKAKRAHLEFLVPARSEIQFEMMRIYRMFDDYPEAFKEGDDRWDMLGWLVGITFSLWRAVFQAQESLELVHNLAEAKRLLTKTIEDNSVGYMDEKKSWSLGYYLNNARFRILPAYELLHSHEKNDSLNQRIEETRRALNEIHERPLPGPQGAQEKSQKEWRSGLLPVSRTLS